MRRVLTAVLVLAMVVGMGSVAFARNGINGFAGKSQVEHLYLFEKDLTDWNVVEDGAYGKAVFNWKHSTVAFEGWGLAPETEYALIFYYEPAEGDWTNRKIQKVSSGVSDTEGYLEIGRVAFEFEVPAMVNETGTYYKVWLVPCASIDELGQIQWINPEMFLFESREFYI